MCIFSVKATLRREFGIDRALLPMAFTVQSAELGRERLDLRFGRDDWAFMTADDAAKALVAWLHTHQGGGDLSLAEKVCQ